MSAEKVIAIFDVGKTNKKLLLFNERYQLVHETSVRLPEITDEDGFACEDVHALTNWMITEFEALSIDARFQLAALNFSGYGASLVHLDKSGEPCTPLYNYLKPFPEKLSRQFYAQYGSAEKIAAETASPALGSLNSGLQLYRLKHESPQTFARIKTSLHLPQYLSYVLSGKKCTDLTSLGCHTALWDFRTNNYHQWVLSEKLDEKFAPILKGNALVNDNPQSARQPPIGVGLHDSSAALIPYLRHFQSPFILVSTGTWCISMNPFNDTPLLAGELEHDCLCYLSYTGAQVKSSRLFAGNEHEQQVRRLNDFFHMDDQYSSHIHYSDDVMTALGATVAKPASSTKLSLKQSAFVSRELDDFSDFDTAYHQLMMDIIAQQQFSTNLVMTPSVKHIYVDGGFSKNEIYMNLLARRFPDLQVAAAAVPQSTGLGAALAIHKHWNPNPVPSDLIELKRYQ